MQIYWLFKQAPPWWEALLRWSSPFFVLLEGVVQWPSSLHLATGDRPNERLTGPIVLQSTLLVIQSAGHISRYLIEEKSDLWQIVFLCMRFFVLHTMS